MKKVFTIVLAAALTLALIPAASVMAVGDNGQCDSVVNDPPIAIGAGWSATTAVPPAFFWSGTIPVLSVSGPFTFTSTGVVRVDVTDDFLKGDQFNVYDNAVLVGTTSLVAVDDTSSDVGPDAAFIDPTYSSGSFFLGPGSHSIDIEAIGNSFSGGRGYIRVVQVGGIGDIKEPTPFTPVPSGNGRAVAFDGMDLYYTITASNDIYKVSTSNVPLATIDTDVLYGSLSWDRSRGVLWGGTYDGSTEVHTIDPATGTETLMFDETAFGGIAADSAYGAGTENYIDGLAYDATDDTLWLSGDACATIYHVNIAGGLLGSFSVPMHPSTAAQGYSTGITVAPGGYLEIAMQAGADLGPHVIAKVTKEDPSTIVYSFVALATNNPGVEGIAYDPNTYAPRAVVWTNQFGAVNALTAFDVQVTRTLGYWKNHSDDAVEFLPIVLGPGCTDVITAQDVKDIMKAAKAKDAADMLKAQLLAAKLNVAMGDVLPEDFTAITPFIDAADELLGRNVCHPETGRKGADRAEATDLIYELDMFNNKYSP